MNARPHAMIPIVPEAIEAYAAKHSSPECPLLAELARETHAKTTLPQMLVGHLEGAFLRFLVQVSGARRVLEIGTFTGYSALAMAQGLPEDGELITCDIDEKSTEIARRFWKRSDHGSKIHLKLGPALQTIKTLKGPFDFVFLDADKENYRNYWEACLPMLRPGGILAVDNTLWSGRALDPQQPTDHAIAEFNDFAARDTRADVILATVRDGLTLARKK